MKKTQRTIQSLSRAFQILDCFDAFHQRLTLAELAKMCNLNINTTRGLVNTLVYHQYLAHDQRANSYHLGLAFIPKADLVEETTILHTKDILQPLLKDWANEFTMSTRLIMMEEGQLITLYTEVPDNARYLLMTRSALPFPLHATSSGKIYLSSLREEELKKYASHTKLVPYTDATISTVEALTGEIEKVGREGYALELGEVYDGIGSMALPVKNHRGRIYASISFLSSNEEILEQRERILQVVEPVLQALAQRGY
ncbi:MAG: IclR family transcriptional regulator [Tissierellia bacterium]|nr:IclR family transcriptional regulator [Tissierellia bacterium]